MLEKYWKILVVIGAILAAGASGGTYAYELELRVAENTLSRLLQDYERLVLRKASRRLSIVEYIKYCEAGRKLKIFTHCPAR